MKFVERKIIFHGSYFADFYLEQSIKVQEKIEFVLRIIRQVERVSKKFLRLKREYFELKKTQENETRSN